MPKNILKIILNKDINMEKQNEILVKWENSGLLDGINDEAKLIVAHAFEELSKIILFGDEIISNKIVNMVYPVTKAILFIDNNYINFTVETVKDLVNEILTNLNMSYNNDYDSIKEQCRLNNIQDFETEFLAIFIEKYNKGTINNKKISNNSTTLVIDDVLFELDFIEERVSGLIGDLKKLREKLKK